MSRADSKRQRLEVVSLDADPRGLRRATLSGVGTQAEAMLVR
jgi:hypothetical protein